MELDLSKIIIKPHESYNLKNVITLEEFLAKWQLNYINRLSNIKLFDYRWVKNWNKAQQQEFVKIFYHARGHFHDFLWYLGNHSSNKKLKDIILCNIKEELNGAAKSHEQLYIDFALEFDVDLSKELIDEQYYISFVREFNKLHLKWLAENDEESKICAFSAYEKLDNIDYKSLLDLVTNFNITKKSLRFFKIHTRIEHFESTYKLVKDIWFNFPEKVINSFNFITDHQLNLWNNITQYIQDISNLEI